LIDLNRPETLNASANLPPAGPASRCRRAWLVLLHSRHPANLTADESFAGLNEVLLVHEPMHTVGADDLYHRGTGLPVYPEGFVQPDREPLYPQSKAEIMAGRIPVAPGRTVRAGRLEQTAIGPETAGAIGWIENYRSD